MDCRPFGTRRFARTILLGLALAALSVLAAACGGSSASEQASSPDVIFTANDDQPAGDDDLGSPTTNSTSTPTVPSESMPSESMPSESVPPESVPPVSLAPETTAPIETAYPLQTPPVIPAYDTAWEMAYLATDAEIVAYLDHLYESGFSGFWFIALPFGGTNLYPREIPDVGDNIANISDDGLVTLSSGYTRRISFILDEAERRHLGVGIVAAWAKANSCKTAGITADNAYAYGASIGASFDHPALDYWVLGGDLPYEEKCVGAGPRRILEDVSAALEAGIRSSGAEQPAAFHTGAGASNYDQLFDRDFVDVGAVQTGHCQDASTMKAKLGPVVQRTDKPVILAESRYYQLAPQWPGCLHGVGNPVSADDIRADVQAALDIGISAVLFGDGQRYQWCRDKSDGDVFDLVGPGYDCPNGVVDTFNSPGEEAFLETVRR